MKTSPHHNTTHCLAVQLSASTPTDTVTPHHPLPHQQPHPPPPPPLKTQPPSAISRATAPACNIARTHRHTHTHTHVHTYLPSHLCTQHHVPLSLALYLPLSLRPVKAFATEHTLHRYPHRRPVLEPPLISGRANRRAAVYLALPPPTASAITTTWTSSQRIAPGACHMSNLKPRSPDKTRSMCYRCYKEKYNNITKW